MRVCPPTGVVRTSSLLLLSAAGVCGQQFALSHASAAVYCLPGSPKPLGLLGLEQELSKV